MTNFEQKWSKAYTTEFFAAVVLYGLLLFATRKLLPSVEDDLARGGLSLLPMLGIGAMTWAIVRALFRADELQQRRLLEIMTIASAVTILLTLAYGFLETSIALPRLSMFVVWRVMALCWIVVSLIYALCGKIAWIWPWSRS